MPRAPTVCESYLSAYWVSLAFMVAIVVGLAAIGLAVAGSALARRASLAAIALSVVVFGVGALVAYDVLGSGEGPLPPDLRGFYDDEHARDVAKLPRSSARSARSGKRRSRATRARSASPRARATPACRSSSASSRSG
jgi:hypothetical protein